jgi:hypothetical protein
MFLAFQGAVIAAVVTYFICLLFTMNESYSTHFFLKEFGMPALFSYPLFTSYTATMMVEVYGTCATLFISFSCELSTKYWVKKCW